MIWDFFKVLFSTKKKPDMTPSAALVEDTREEVSDIGSLFSSFRNSEAPKVSPPTVINENQEPIQPKKHGIIKNKETVMAEIFLVVLDGTGRNNFKALSKQLQNFYFVFAPDEVKAKEMVIYSFMRAQRRPADQLINEIQTALKATKLSAILKNMSPQNNFWTYVPFGRNPGAGQQTILPDQDKLVSRGLNGDMDMTSAVSYNPPPPAGGVEVTAEDLKGVQFSGADGKVINKLRQQGGPVAPLNEEAPPLNPENEVMMKAINDQNTNNQQMMQQMQQMMATMLAMQQQNAAKTVKRGRKVATAPAAPAADGDAPTAE
jgi:hypothetical protein